MFDWLMLWGATQTALVTIIENWKEDPETLSCLKNLAQQHDDWDVEHTIVKAEAQKRQNNSDTLPWLKDDWDFREVLVKAIAKWWRNDLGTLPWLKDLVRHEHNEYVKRYTTAEILRDWESDPHIMPILPLVKYGSRQYIRCTAVEVIAQYWKNDLDTLPWLKEIALQADYRWLCDAILGLSRS